MDDNMYLLICLVMLIVWLVYSSWNSMEEEVQSESELHASDRYSVAEKITKEFEKK